MRIEGFDLRTDTAQWDGDGRFEWVYEEDYQGMPCYRLSIRDERFDPFTDWSTSAKHTLPLLPNRTYVLSGLLNTNFKRPCEVNMGLKMVDASGTQVIWALNGIPNKTTGWQRWEYSITADPRAVHGVFSALIIGYPLKGSQIRIADVSFVELPPKPLEAYPRGRGATFRGGPGDLPMAIEKVHRESGGIVVETTGARYVFNTAADTITCHQRQEKQREVVEWKSSVPLKGMNVKSKSKTECVLGNDNVTFGVQCDSLVMVVPHEDMILTCVSRIGGKWNRLAEGHFFVVDDYGGFAVNPDIPAGSGRRARVQIGESWSSVQPGRVRPDMVDFCNTANNQTFVSQAKPGWQICWQISPGERLGISIFPPRPYPWKQSFEFSWLLANRKDPLDQYGRRKRGPEHVEILWDFLQRSWAMSWGPKHVPYDEKLLRSHIAAVKKVGAHPVLYSSAHWYYSRDAKEFIEEIQRLRDTYEIEGIYYDGIPSQEWVVAYEEMRMTRELFPSGPVIVHSTGQAYNGNPPLGEPALKIPAIETYATATYAGELVYGVGADWPLLKYTLSQYRTANCIGVMKGDAWEGLNDTEKKTAFLKYNGRCQYRKYPAEYYKVLEALYMLWQEKGDEPDFYDKHYLTKYDDLTEF